MGLIVIIPRRQMQTCSKPLARVYSAVYIYIYYTYVYINYIYTYIWITCIYTYIYINHIYIHIIYIYIYTQIYIYIYTHNANDYIDKRIILISHKPILASRPSPPWRRGACGCGMAQRGLARCRLQVSENVATPKSSIFSRDFPWTMHFGDPMEPPKCFLLLVQADPADCN